MLVYLYNILYSAGIEIKKRFCQMFLIIVSYILSRIKIQPENIVDQVVLHKYVYNNATFVRMFGTACFFTHVRIFARPDFILSMCWVIFGSYVYFKYS